MKRIVAGRASTRGFSIVEPLVLVVILAVVISGTGLLLNMVNRSSTNARLQIKLNEDIESDLSLVRQLADRLTCCSGTCIVATLDANGLATFASVDSGTAGSSCATNNPRNSSFFFPTKDNLATASPISPTSSAREPDAVTELCDPSVAANNTAMLTPLLNAVNALPNPPSGQAFTRTAAIQPNKVLRVSYTDTTNNRVTRVVNVVPQMANFCT